MTGGELSSGGRGNGVAQWGTFGLELSGWDICTNCVNLGQFSWGPGVKMSHRKAKKAPSLQ